MDIKINKVAKKNRKILENLMQLYLHDLSLYFPIDFNSNKGLYEYDLDPYFDKNYAFFIKSNDDILGFVLIDDNGDNNYEISEIFVLNNYKCKNIGENAVSKVFNKFKGNWTIKAVPSSPKAESFWKKTISKYTKDNYKLLHTGKYDRAEFYFSNNK